MGIYTLLFWILGLPEWAIPLKPEAGLEISYESSHEPSFGQSGLRMAADLGVFPELNENWALGVELQMTEASHLEARQDGVWLSNGMSSKPIQIGQLYFAHRPHPAFLWSGGKFKMPFHSSPIIWNPQRRPEGFYQAINFESLSRKSLLKIHGAEFVIDHHDSKTSWLFVGGYQWNMNWSEYVQSRQSIQAYHFWNLTDRISQVSVQRGSEYQIDADQYEIENQKFLPVEIEAEISSNPLGIFTSLRSAFVLNLRSEDKQRAFFVESQIGRAWKARNFLGKVAFLYNEPMASFAYFSDRDYAYANRRSGLFELNYFFSDHLRFGGSYLISKKIAESIFQGDRHEWILRMEIRL